MLQLCRINPNDEKSIVPSRFQIGDVDHMLATALGDAGAGHNVYIEPRTVRADLRGNKRGGLEDTAWVFGFVIDSDADKGKAGHVVAKPTLATETSAGNFHLWYLLRGRSRQRRRSQLATPSARAPAPTKTPASSRSAIALPARPTFPRQPSVRAAVSISSRPGSSNTPAGCGIPTSSWPHSPRR